MEELYAVYLKERAGRKLRLTQLQVTSPGIHPAGGVNPHPFGLNRLGRPVP